MLAQHTPCLPGLDVENNQAAGRTGVGQIGEPSIGSDADIVQVAGWTSHIRTDRKGPLHVVRFQVDLDDLGSTLDCLLGVRSRWIDHPKRSAAVRNDALNAHEMIVWRYFGHPRVAPRVPFLIRVGLGGSV